jgi:hypothetical protein
MLLAGDEEEGKYQDTKEKCSILSGAFFAYSSSLLFTMITKLGTLALPKGPKIQLSEDSPQANAPL